MACLITYPDGTTSYCRNEDEVHTELGRRSKLGLSWGKVEEVAW